VVYLMWTYDALLPAVAQPGAVVRKVLRTKWDARAVEPQYVPVEGALVAAVDDAGRPLSGTKTIARSQADGRFMLLEGQYRGGNMRLKFELGGEVRYATAYPAERLEWTRYDWGIFESTLKFYRLVATANASFPAAEPPPPPPVIQIHVMKLLEGGTRQDTNGLVVAGTPLVIGFNSSKDLAIRTASIQGGSYNAKGPLANDPSGFAYVLADPVSADGSYTPP